VAALTNQPPVRCEWNWRLPWPIILADRVQVQQVINLNLVMNGIEACNRSRNRPRETVIRSDQDETQQMLISVTDWRLRDFHRECGPAVKTPSSPPNPAAWGWGFSNRPFDHRSPRLAGCGPTANLPHGATFQFTVPGERRHCDREVAVRVVSRTAWRAGQPLDTMPIGRRAFRRGDIPMRGRHAFRTSRATEKE